MKVVVAVDSFKGSLTAGQACEIIRETFLQHNSSLEVVCKPLADGGEGTASIVLSATDSRWIDCFVTGPLPPIQVKAGFVWIEETKTALIDVEALKKEIGILGKQVERYNKGYGAGAFTLEELKKYTEPIREKISQFQTQISKATSESNQTHLEAPNKQEMEAFTEKAKQTLQNLNFALKRAIILNTVEKVIASKEHLQVNGYLPLNVSLCYEDRNRRAAKRGKINAFQGADPRAS